MAKLLYSKREEGIECQTYDLFTTMAPLRADASRRDHSNRRREFLPQGTMGAEGEESPAPQGGVDTVGGRKFSFPLRKKRVGNIDLFIL
jgi:hypothetical protein